MGEINNMFVIKITIQVVCSTKVSLVILHISPVFCGVRKMETKNLGSSENFFDHSHIAVKVGYVLKKKPYQGKGDDGIQREGPFGF